MLRLPNVAVENGERHARLPWFQSGRRAYIGVEIAANTKRFRNVTHVTFTAPSSSYGLAVKTIQTPQRGYDNDQLS
jgi:hypothetical protein